MTVSNNRLYGGFIRQFRKEKNISCEKLALGVCDESSLRKFENGEKKLNWFIKERLLARLGESEFQFECYLDNSDYREYEERKLVLNSVKSGDVELLKQFEEKYIGDNLKQQFACEMRYLYNRQRAASKIKFYSDYEIIELLKKILSYTLVIENGVNIVNRCLSVNEFFFVIEYALTLNYDDGLSVLSQLERIITEDYANTELELFVYTKLVWGYTIINDKFEERAGRSTFNEKLIKALKLIGNNGRLYYLDDLVAAASKSKAFDDETAKKYNQYLELLSKIYGSKINFSSDWLIYSEGYYVRMGELIHKRRVMKGLTIARLADGICDSRTISRIEHGQSDGNQEIIFLILKKLKLPDVYQHTDFISDSVEVYREEKLLRKKLGSGDYSGALLCLDNIKNKIDISNVFNSQKIMMTEAGIAYRMGKISEFEVITKYTEALNKTVVLKELDSGELFLSRAEFNCLYQIISAYIVDEKVSFVKKIVKKLFAGQNGFDEDIKIYEYLLISLGIDSYKHGEIQDLKSYFESLFCYEVLHGRSYLLDFAMKSIETGLKYKQDSSRLAYSMEDIKLFRSLCVFFKGV